MQAENLFITVPEVTLPNGIVVPSFQVGQYACSQGKKGVAIVTADGIPWVRINFKKAKAACKKIGGKLITELQWLAIAYDTSQQDINWTGGKVGDGDMFQGLRNNTVSEAQPGNYVSTDTTEQRWLTLSNGERICDMNGNIHQWVFDNVQGDKNGIIAKDFATDSPSITTPQFLSEENGMGLEWSGNVLIRGLYYDAGAGEGIFNLNFIGPAYRCDGIGFRCTKPIMKG